MRWFVKIQDEVCQPTTNQESVARHLESATPNHFVVISTPLPALDVRRSIRPRLAFSSLSYPCQYFFSSHQQPTHNTPGSLISKTGFSESNSSL